MVAFLYYGILVGYLCRQCWQCFGVSSLALAVESELRRWSVLRRTRFGWSRWMELYRRDELIYGLSISYLSKFLDFSSVYSLAPYLRKLSFLAGQVRGRGGDPRALGVAVAYYAVVWRSSIEGRSLDLRLRDLFVFSSRPSIYRSLKILVCRVLGHSEVFYRLLLSRRLRTCSYSVYGGDRIYVRSGLVVVRAPSLVIVDERVVRGVYRVPRGCSFEVYCLPDNLYLTGDRYMATVELKMRFRVLDLLELLRTKLGDTFTARDVAEVLATDSRYAGRLLSLLESRGYLEIVDEKPVRVYRIRDR